MNKVVKKLGTSPEQVFNKSCTSHEQVVKKLKRRSSAQMDKVMCESVKLSLSSLRLS